MEEERVITNLDHHAKMMEERKSLSDAKRVRTDAFTTIDHSKAATQAIKVINSSNLDPFVKRVMTLRLIDPVVLGQERTHISIALELGSTTDEVIEAEQYGMEAIAAMLEKVSLPDFQANYDRDRRVQEAVNGLIVNG